MVKSQCWKWSPARARAGTSEILRHHHVTVHCTACSALNCGDIPMTVQCLMGRIKIQFKMNINWIQRREREFIKIKMFIGTFNVGWIEWECVIIFKIHYDYQNSLGGKFLIKFASIIISFHLLSQKCFYYTWLRKAHSFFQTLDTNAELFD